MLEANTACRALLATDTTLFRCWVAPDILVAETFSGGLDELMIQSAPDRAYEVLAALLNNSLRAQTKRR